MCTSDQRGEETELLEHDTACLTQGTGNAIRFSGFAIWDGAVLSTVVVIRSGNPSGAIDAIHTSPTTWRGDEKLTGYIE